MTIKVDIRYSKSAKWELDDVNNIGVEIEVIESKFTNKLIMKTYNKSGLPDRVEEFTLSNLFYSEWLLKYKVNKNFDKIKHRLIEWGLPSDIKFPFKEKLGSK